MTVYEVVLTGTLDAEPMLHVLHYDITGSTDLQAFTDAIKVEIQAGLAAELVNSAVYQGCTIRLDAPGSVGVFYPFTTGQVNGTAVGQNYAAIVAANVRKLTNGTTRPTTGRVYQSGIPVGGFNTDGYLLPAAQSGLNAGWENLRIIEFDAVGEGAMQIKASNPSAPNTNAYNPVVTFNTKGQLSTQRRRNYNT